MPISLHYMPYYNQPVPQAPSSRTRWWPSTWGASCATIHACGSGFPALVAGGRQTADAGGRPPSV